MAVNRPSWHFEPVQLEGQMHLATPLTAVHSPPFQHPPSHVTAKKQTQVTPVSSGVDDIVIPFLKWNLVALILEIDYSLCPKGIASVNYFDWTPEPLILFVIN